MLSDLYNKKVGSLGVVLSKEVGLRAPSTAAANPTLVGDRTKSRFPSIVREKYGDHCRSDFVSTSTWPIFLARSSWSSGGKLIQAPGCERRKPGCRAEQAIAAPAVVRMNSRRLMPSAPS